MAKEITELKRKLAESQASQDIYSEKLAKTSIKADIADATKMIETLEANVAPVVRVRVETPD